MTSWLAWSSAAQSLAERPMLVLQRNDVQLSADARSRRRLQPVCWYSVRAPACAQVALVILAATMVLWNQPYQLLSSNYPHRWADDERNSGVIERSHSPAVVSVNRTAELTGFNSRPKSGRSIVWHPSFRSTIRCRSSQDWPQDLPPCVARGGRLSSQRIK
jgi:hypothetical protein